MKTPTFASPPNKYEPDQHFRLPTMTPKPGALVTVLYRRTPDLIFNTGYYLSTHIPLLTGKWTTYGLLNTIFCEATSESEFSYQLIMAWGNLEEYDNAMKDEEVLEILMGDVRNFTNGTPSFVVGKVLG
jgi:hypothetical protein